MTHEQVLNQEIIPWENLSEKQKNILRFTYTFSTESKLPPTVRQIAQATKISSTSVVNYNLKILQDLGYILRIPKISRGLILTERFEKEILPKILQDDETAKNPIKSASES